MQDMAYRSVETLVLRHTVKVTLSVFCGKDVTVFIDLKFVFQDIENQLDKHRMLW